MSADHHVLAGRPHDDVIWIFGFGSLISHPRAEGPYQTCRITPYKPYSDLPLMPFHCHQLETLAFPHTDFAYAERVEGYVKGWRRVFHQVRLCGCCVGPGSTWAITRTAGPMCNLVLQGSTDHRGTPGADATPPPPLPTRKNACLCLSWLQLVSSHHGLCRGAGAHGHIDRGTRLYYGMARHKIWCTS